MTEPAPTDRHQKMVTTVAMLLRQSESAEKIGQDAESIAFQERAFQIMAKYGIDEALARAKRDGLDAKKIDPKADHIYITLAGKYRPMQAVLLHQVAAAMHCKSLQLGKMGQITLKVYGMPDHLQRFQDVWELLAPQAVRGMTRAEPPHGYNHSGELRVYRRNWLAGFAAEVVNRVYKAENAAAESAGALVLYKSDLERAETAMYAEYPDAAPIRSRRILDRGGREQGRQAGKTAQLQRSLS